MGYLKICKGAGNTDVWVLLGKADTEATRRLPVSVQVIGRRFGKKRFCE